MKEQLRRALIFFAKGAYSKRNLPTPDLHHIAKHGIKFEPSMITKENIWIQNGSGYSPMDLAFKYHNVDFIITVQKHLGDQIEKQSFTNTPIDIILQYDPDASSGLPH